MIKVIFVPGYHNGAIDMLAPKKRMWFAWLKSKLEAEGIEVIAKDYPDAWICRASEWLPYLKKLGADENTILIGHSTGAVAAMRYGENNKLLGTVLVGGYYTDLGEPEEKQAGYFDEPWQWGKIKQNQQWIIQFHSTDDPFIPDEEAHHVHEMLKTELHEFHDRGHFGGDRTSLEFPELLEALISKLR
ncbi:MAG TPA: alpha/beta hydrolase [Patescibacteria group bacterium]|nr:alpha/beta hydrolase [Patescibacteria group bacterium]